MNVDDIYKRASRLFGDDAGVQLQYNDVVAWINDSQRQIATQTELLQVRAVTDLIAGQMNYNRPSDILNLRSVRAYGLRLNGLSLAEADEQFPLYDQPANQETGNPLFYWVWGNTISLYPVPSLYQAAGMTMLYTRAPVQVAVSTDIPELPLKYHDAILSHVLQCAYEMDDDIQQAQYRATIKTTGIQLLGEQEDRVNEEFYEVINIRTEDW